MIPVYSSITGELQIGPFDYEFFDNADFFANAPDDFILQVIRDWSYKIYTKYIKASQGGSHYACKADGKPQPCPQVLCGKEGKRAWG